MGYAGLSQISMGASAHNHILSNVKTRCDAFPQKRRSGFDFADMSLLLIRPAKDIINGSSVKIRKPN